MAFSCTRPKTKDDICENIQLEKEINKLSKENVELNNLNINDNDNDINFIIKKLIKKNKCISLSLSNNKITSNGIEILMNYLKALLPLKIKSQLR
jgi:hypothetical protein